MYLINENEELMLVITTKYCTRCVVKMIDVMIKMAGVFNGFLNLR